MSACDLGPHERDQNNSLIPIQVPRKQNARYAAQLPEPPRGCAAFAQAGACPVPAPMDSRIAGRQSSRCASTKVRTTRAPRFPPCRGTPRIWSALLMVWRRGSRVSILIAHIRRVLTRILQALPSSFLGQHAIFPLCATPWRRAAKLGLTSLEKHERRGEWFPVEERQIAPTRVRLPRGWRTTGLRV